jgi:hypothetical protein
MKKIKLQLTAGQVVILNEMLTYLFNSRKILEDLPMEYYVLAEFYQRFAGRFVCITGKPFALKLSEACALQRIMQLLRWPVRGGGDTATAILWQLSPKFECKKQLNNGK